MGRNIENGETKPEGVLVKAHCRRGRERRPLKNYSSGGLESDLIVQSFGDQVRRTLYFIFGAKIQISCLIYHGQ